jgi:hypothetical protein
MQADPRASLVIYLLSGSNPWIKGKDHTVEALHMAVTVAPVNVRANKFSATMFVARGGSLMGHEPSTWPGVLCVHLRQHLRKKRRERKVVDDADKVFNGRFVRAGRVRAGTDLRGRERKKGSVPYQRTRRVGSDVYFGPNNSPRTNRMSVSMLSATIREPTATTTTTIAGW